MTVSTLRVYRDAQADLWIEVSPGQFLALDWPTIDDLLMVFTPVSESELSRDYGPVAFVTLLGKSAEKRE